MARRGYLQRIAAPLTPGEPVLFPVPTPAAEDARPAVPAGKPGTAAPAAAAPVVRRKRAARGQIAAMDQKPVPRAGIGAPQGDPNAAPGEAPEMPARQADTAEDWTAPAAVFAPPATKPVFLPAATEPGEKTPPASKPQAALSGTSPAPPGEPDLYQNPQPPPPPASRVMPANAGIHDFLSTTRSFATSQSHLVREPAADPPQYAATQPAEHPPAPMPPRIHIGTIEIRTTPPPAPAAPPPAQAAPPPTAAPRTAAAPSPPRGYAWRFGLIQGW